MTDSTSNDFAPGLLDKTVQQQVTIQSLAALKDILNNGALVDASPRSKLNFIAGSGISYTLADNPGNDRVDVTIAAAGGQLDLATISADVGSITATTEGTAQAVITGNSVTYDGTKNKVEFWAPGYLNTGADELLTIVLLRDSTVIGQAKFDCAKTATNWPMYVVMYDTPSAAAHTYKAQAFVTASTGTVKAGAGGSGAIANAFLRVTKA